MLAKVAAIRVYFVLIAVLAVVVDSIYSSVRVGAQRWQWFSDLGTRSSINCSGRSGGCGRGAKSKLLSRW